MAAGDLVIGQISDTHIGSRIEDGVDLNLERLDRVLDHLTAMARRPDLLLVTGDLADGDDEAPYRLLKERLDRFGVPFHVCLGNHDSRSAARQAFGGPEGFFHYVVDGHPLRLIVLDTLEEGRHGGAFCEKRSDWLREKLSQAQDVPTLVALHHPPIDSGLAWVTTSPAEPWLQRLDAALAAHRRLVGLVSGHIHRPVAASRNGVPVLVCPPVAAQLALDLSPLYPESPDDRTLVLDGPPGYALHLWRGGSLTTHFDFVQDRPVLLRFDERVQPMIRSMFAERA